MRADWHNENDALCYRLQDALNTGRIAREDEALAEHLILAHIHSRPRTYTKRQKLLIHRILAAPPGGAIAASSSTVSHFPVP